MSTDKSKAPEMHKTSRMSEHSKQVIAQIHKDGPQTLAQLRPLVGGYDSEICKRLRNLCTAGWKRSKGQSSAGPSVVQRRGCLRRAKLPARSRRLHPRWASSRCRARSM